MSIFCVCLAVFASSFDSSADASDAQNSSGSSAAISSALPASRVQQPSRFAHYDMFEMPAGGFVRSSFTAVAIVTSASVMTASSD